MNARRFAAYSGGALALVASLALAGSGGNPPVKVGPIAVVGADDIGSCNNVWASDSFNWFYTVSSNHDGSFHVRVEEKNGTFITVAGQSPGACISGSDNGNTVDADVSGKLHGVYDGTVTPGPNPFDWKACGNKGQTCAVACNFAMAGGGSCTTAILDVLFGVGNWDWVIVPGGGHWNWMAEYNARRNGNYRDVGPLNWPTNNRGDITGSP